MKHPRKKATRTSAFGSPGRVSHDSSPFYAGELYAHVPREQELAYRENPIPPEYLNRIFHHSSEDMAELPDDSVHLMVTSPPYNVGKEYDQDITLEEYLAFLNRVWRETYRVLVPGGRACVNVANLGRKPYIPLHAYVIQGMAEIGFLMRGEIIWNKAASSAGSTAWGSWRSPANPTLRDVHEYILIFSKGNFSRKNPHRRQTTISREEFLEYTKSVWTFPAESARKVGHPAPFPVQLPYRLIQLYTYEGEVVLDPFMGSGQAAIAALQADRHYVGYEIDPEYHTLAQSRLRTVPPASVPASAPASPAAPVAPASAPVAPASVPAQSTGQAPEASSGGPETSEDVVVYKRRLPHWRQEGAVYFVTWRLDQMQPELTANERGLVASALRYFDGARYELLAYVVMADHVHVLVRAGAGVRLQDLVRSWKSYTAHGLQRHSAKKGSIWQKEYFDRIIRNEGEFYEKCQYILNNPRQKWPELESYQWVWAKGD